MLRAFAADGVLERNFVLPEFDADTPFPAARAIGFHLVDHVVHAWDIATSLGVDAEFGPEVLEAALTVARAVPVGEARLAPGAAFGPPVDVPAGPASRLDEIVAVLGRTPHGSH